MIDRLDRRQDGERLARVETRLDSVDEKLESLPTISKAITAIELVMAKESGQRSMLKYVGHAASVILGGILGAIGGIMSAYAAIANAAKHMANG